MLLKAGDKVVVEECSTKIGRPRILNFDEIKSGNGRWLSGTVVGIFDNTVTLMYAGSLTSYRYDKKLIGTYIIPAAWKHIQFHKGDHVICEQRLSEWKVGEVLYHHKGAGELRFRFFNRSWTELVRSSYAGRHVLPVAGAIIDLDHENDDRDEPLVTKPECTCKPMALLSGVFDAACRYHSKV